MQLNIFTSERAWRRASQWIMVVKCRWWSSKSSCPELLSVLYIGAVRMIEHEVWSIGRPYVPFIAITILQTSCTIIVIAPMYNIDKSSGHEIYCSTTGTLLLLARFGGNGRLKECSKTLIWGYPSYAMLFFGRRTKLPSEIITLARESIGPLPSSFTS